MTNTSTKLGLETRCGYYFDREITERELCTLFNYISQQSKAQVNYTKTVVKKMGDWITGEYKPPRICSLGVQGSITTKALDTIEYRCDSSWDENERVKFLGITFQIAPDNWDELNPERKLLIVKVCESAEQYFANHPATHK